MKAEKEEMLAQSQATRLSESDAAVNLAATQAAHQEALDKLASENASALAAQKRSMEEDMALMRIELIIRLSICVRQGEIE